MTSGRVGCDPHRPTGRRPLNVVKASGKGYAPALSLTSVLALCSSSSATAAESPRSAADMRTVLPSLFLTSVSAACLFKRRNAYAQGRPH